MKFTEKTKIWEDGADHFVTEEKVFEINTTEEEIRSEFKGFVPPHEMDEDFWSKEKQFARIKLAEWRNQGHFMGDDVYQQILNILK